MKELNTKYNIEFSIENFLVESLEDREEFGCWANICIVNYSRLPIMICSVNFI